MPLSGRSVAFAALATAAAIALGGVQRAAAYELLFKPGSQVLRAKDNRASLSAIVDFLRNHGGRADIEPTIVGEVSAGCGRDCAELTLLRRRVEAIALAVRAQSSNELTAQLRWSAVPSTVSAPRRVDMVRFAIRLADGNVRTQCPVGVEVFDPQMPAGLDGRDIWIGLAEAQLHRVTPRARARLSGPGQLVLESGGDARVVLQPADPARAEYALPIATAAERSVLRIVFNERTGRVDGTDVAGKAMGDVIRPWTGPKTRPPGEELQACEFQLGAWRQGRPR